MYRDTLILLILKEIFQDPYLVNHLHNLVLNEEINEMLLKEIILILQIQVHHHHLFIQLLQFLVERVRAEV